MLREAISDKLVHALGVSPERAGDRDWMRATALAVRDRLVDIRLSQPDAAPDGEREVSYLSLEFLVGRGLRDNLGNLGLLDAARGALADLGVDFERIRKAELDAALGNGGLGRLAACFMESLASLDIPAVGYGLRYEYGLFRQSVIDGEQREAPDDWGANADPWSFQRPNAIVTVGFGGSVREEVGPDGRMRRIWTPEENVLAVPSDMLVAGWRGRRVNVLRLWSARSAEPLSLEMFNDGDHVGAAAARIRAEAISQVLYPGDSNPAGQELRLRQEYFFTAASLADLLRRHLEAGRALADLASHAAIQLNDTHPAIAVAELMRLLVDEHDLAWEDAWSITQEVLNYTNHTLLPEALESWPVDLMEGMLPRHMEIIYAINLAYLEQARERLGAEDALLRRLSIIDETNGRRVRMGNLAFVGARRVNGVSALHTRLMRETVFADLDRALPGRIVNKTNGITFRRWLHQANSGLTALLVEAAGAGVLDDPERLRAIEPLAGDAAFVERFVAQRRHAKERLADLVRERTGVVVDPSALFDVQIKRIHEYKRQLLNILETVALYLAMKDDPDREWPSRVKIIAGKAAAGYAQAKLVIRLANAVGALVNDDPDIRGRLKLVFVPDYNVSVAEAIIPASDLSEQISTAGMEASGTGNMKLALNGALTIGTLDGANVEMREHVGAENIFIFGATAQEASELLASGYASAPTLDRSTRLARALFEIESGLFSPDDPDRFAPLCSAVAHADRYLVAADFDAYWDAQRRIDGLWYDQASWMTMAILNTARMGWFSSDRTIREYADEIWRTPAR
ncbi:MAG: glycogen/starch/alpha-glucan phosphorylase [Salinarimonadaceae bacterium]|nr:MAG: glycogen/starch/alpha-glucan phosphorylase [Salinarimonadaceae bacterium]